MLSQLLQRQEATAILMYRESVKDVPISTYGMEEWICSLLASQKKELIEEIRKEVERNIKAFEGLPVIALRIVTNYLNEALPHCGERLR